MENTIQNGVAVDPRSDDLKAKDYIHTAGAVTPNWVVKTNFKRFNQRNQDGSFSCVFQAGAKALEVLTGKTISATPYFWRKNYPGEGSWPQDMGDILYNRYSCLETVSPSQNQDEIVMNTIKPLTTNIGITGYRTITDPKNIELIAEAIEAYRQCVLIFDSNSEEWQITPIYLGTPVTFGHAICAVDYGIVNGVKTIICEDSAGQWSSPDGLRLITENFLQNRCRGALYFLGAKDVTVPQDPSFVFNNDMKYGQTSNDIVELQKRLGILPKTGFYGVLTKKAVLDYQIANKVPLSWYERYWLAGSVCGAKTRAKLNS